MRKSRSVVCLLVLLTGCASTPQMTYTYFPTKATTWVTVTQTISCNVAKTELIFINTPSIVTTYASDRNDPILFDASPLKNVFADSELTFNWFDDGRLKSISQSATGEAEAIVKSAFTLLTALGVVGFVRPEVATIPQCSNLPDLSAGKSVTLVYEISVDYRTVTFDQPITIPPKAGYGSLFAQFQGANLPTMEYRASTPALDRAVAMQNPGDPTFVFMLKLRRTAQTSVSVLAAGSPIASSSVVIPTTTELSVPIPMPPLFGKQVFGLTLNEAGSITSLTYNGTNGTAGALNAVNTAVSTLSPGDAAKAAALKAQADFIAQSARLARCQASPATCQ